MQCQFMLFCADCNDELASAIHSRTSRKQPASGPPAVDKAATRGSPFTWRAPPLLVVVLGALAGMGLSFAR